MAYLESAPAANDDDIADLYADLDDQVAAALADAVESGGSNARYSDPGTDGEEEGPDTDAGVKDVVDLGDGTAGYSSSDESEDDLRIVLDEDAGAPPPGRGEACGEENEQGEDSGSRAKCSSITDGGLSKFGHLHCKGLLKNTMAPMAGQGDQGRLHALQKEFYFFVPRNRTVFDINIEAFQQKPWRQNGVDITDYFNFGLDEESWGNYCLSMEQLRQRARLFATEPLGLNQESQSYIESKVMSNGANHSGFVERNDLAKGRAIQVVSGVCERLPSADMCHPRQRDSDVVIQVNMMLSPPNSSTSDDSSTVKYRHVTTEGTSIGHHDAKRLKDTSFMVDSAVDKELHFGGTSECTRSKLGRENSAGVRDQSSSPAYSDMLSEASTEDCFLKRAQRHAGSKTLYADNKLKDEPVRSDCCSHSNKSDQESGESDYHGCTPSPTDDRYCKTTKISMRNKSSFPGEDIFSDFFMNCQSDRNFLISRYEATKEHNRQSLAVGRHAIVDKQEKTSDEYTGRYAGKYKQKRTGSTFRSNGDRDAVHNAKHDYSFLKRVASRNDEQYFSNNSNNQHRQFSWNEIIDEEDTMGYFSSAKEQQGRRDHEGRYHSMLKAELSDNVDEAIYRERYHHEKRRSFKCGHNGDNKFLHYKDYRFGQFLDPEVIGKSRSRRRFADNKEEHVRHFDYFELHPQANDNHKSSERRWPNAVVFRQLQPTFMSSRSRHIDNRRIPRAKVMKYYSDGYHEKNKQHNSSYPVDSTKRSAVYISAAAETGTCILPAKRKVHADLKSMHCKDPLGLPFPKGSRLMHDKPVISDKKFYASRVHNSSMEISREAIHSFNDMRNINVISSIFGERRHGLMDLRCKETDSIHLKDRKTKVYLLVCPCACVLTIFWTFVHQCCIIISLRLTRIRDGDESDSEGHLPVDKDLHSSRYYDIPRKMRKLDGSCHYSGNQDLERSMYQKPQNGVGFNEDDEIGGELIGEQDYQNTFSKTKVENPRKVVLKSVIESSSSGPLGVTNVMPKDAVSRIGATMECDGKHILEVMEKMQKRRERFKEPIVQKTEDDGIKKEPLAIACCTDDVKNQRPARKRRWGGG